VGGREGGRDLADVVGLGGRQDISVVGRFNKKTCASSAWGWGLSADEALSSAWAGCFTINFNPDDALCLAPLMERYAAQMERRARMLSSKERGANCTALPFNPSWNMG
jgi:hypothetical protein